MKKYEKRLHYILHNCVGCSIKMQQNEMNIEFPSWEKCKKCRFVPFCRNNGNNGSEFGLISED